MKLFYVVSDTWMGRASQDSRTRHAAERRHLPGDRRTVAVAGRDETDGCVEAIDEREPMTPERAKEVVGNLITKAQLECLDEQERVLRKIAQLRWWQVWRAPDMA